LLHYGDATVTGNNGKNGRQNKLQEEKVEADRIANQECMKQMMARTDDNRERDQDLKGMMKEMDANQVKADGKQEEILAKM
jgi:hypothetical protein